MDDHDTDAGDRPRTWSVPPTVWALLGLALFGVAIAVLLHALRAYHLHDIAAAVRAIPGPRLAAAALLTCASYAVLTGYDVLAFRYLRNRLAYRRVALASFLSYAFANNTGSLSLIAGSGLRYRFYAGWGLSAAEIARVIAFCTVSFWLGFLSLSGALFLAAPFAIPAALHLPAATTRPLGALFLLFPAAYLAANAFSRSPLRIRGRELALPGPGLAAAQLVLASADWALAGWILYLLLPPGADPGAARFLGCYLLAQLAGLASNVPGGLGVFESAMLLLLAPPLPASALFGALLAYRVLYYLAPLAVAGAVLIAREKPWAAASVRRTAHALGRVVPGLVPEVFALAAFTAGAVLLFSGSLPAEAGRFSLLQEMLPLPLLELSHFLGSLAGAGLLVLGRGLQRRLDAAWILTVTLLAVGVAASLLKGLDYEEALALALMLAALAPCRARFYRRGSLLAEPFSAGWVVAVAGVVVAALWLVLFSYKHVEYANNLWWQFAVVGHAPRSMRALVGASSLLLVFAAHRLLHPAPHRPALPGPGELERAAAIARASPRTAGFLALLGDKALLFSRSGAAFLMFGVQGRSWVALGDVVGPAGEAAELLWAFRDLADRHDGRPVFYEVGAELLPLCLDLGLRPLKIGEEARVPLPDFSLEGGAHKGLRHAHHRAAAAGCVFEVVPAETVPALLPEMRRVSDEWLAGRNTREKGFSLGSFRDEYLRRFPAALVRRAGQLVAFANIWPGGGREELSIDLMRHAAEAPPGVMDYLFVELLLWGRAAGYRWFNFGMAPLSGLEDRSLAPLWNKVGAFIYLHGGPFYNFVGLRAYKEKFGPVWSPRYLAIHGGLSAPRALADIAVLVSGGARGVVAK
ncbi:MAG TPA: bifunctional lysylphosphatidylglycerol flippase/synthetase MprF [bacterium]